MPTIFTKIVQGDIPSFKVAESEEFYAFLDIRPLKRGHTLVIPKQEVNYIFDLEEDTYLGLMAFARRVAAAIERTVDCKRIGVAVIGLEVPHVHVHLVPLDAIGDLNFSNKPIDLSDDEMAALASDINGNFK